MDGSSYLSAGFLDTEEILVKTCKSRLQRIQSLTVDCVTIHKETADQRTIKSITLRKLRNILNKYKFDTSCYYSKRVIPRERALFLLAKSIFKTMGYLRANVTKNQVKFEFRGRTRKIDFSLFSSINSP